MIEAKVVKIEEEFLIILSERKYYRLRIGDFLYPAIRTPLGKSELKELGIAGRVGEGQVEKGEGRGGIGGSGPIRRAARRKPAGGGTNRNSAFSERRGGPRPL